MTRVIYEPQFGQHPDGRWWYTLTLHHQGHYWTSREVTFEADGVEAARAHVAQQMRALASALTPPTVREPTRVAAPDGNAP